MKSSKKLLAVFFSVLMLISAISVGFVPGAAVICDHNIGSESTTMVEFSRVDATCRSEGVANYECINCNHTYSVVLPIDPDNHAYGYWTPVAGKEPGCATEGEKIRYCDCGASETGVLPATGKHTYPDESLLDFWWTDENAAVGTVYNGWKILSLPTCISTGLAESVCTECGDAKSTVELHLHSADFIEAKRDEATCAVEGKSYVVCEKCNANYTLTIPVNEENHVLVWETETESTCTQKGVEAAYCHYHRELGVLDTRDIPVKEHSFTNYKYDNNATCTKDGTKTAKCDYCNEKHTLPAEGTVRTCLKRWQFVDSKNSCATGGEAELVCVYCKTVYEKKTFKAGEHINLTVVSVDATCDKDGYKYHKCDSCDYASAPISGTEIKATGHSMRWTEKSLPSCISKQNGVDIGTCTKCGYTEERTVAYEHDYAAIIPECDATCVEDGTTAHLKCVICLEEIEPVVIPAIGHHDADGNGCCDICYEWFVEGPDGNPTSCRCLCHNTNGIAGIFYKIYLFFIKLFGIAQECDCGAIHYEKIGAMK